MPQPVVRKGWVDIDRRAPAVHAGLASISNVPTNIGAAHRVKIFLVVRGQFVEFVRDR